MPTRCNAPARSTRKRCAKHSTKTDLMTFYGHIKFDSTGKNIAKPMALYQILDGKYVVVAPSKFAAEKAVIPRSAAMN